MILFVNLPDVVVGGCAELHGHGPNQVKFDLHHVNGTLAKLPVKPRPGSSGHRTISYSKKAIHSSSLTPCTQEAFSCALAIEHAMLRGSIGVASTCNERPEVAPRQ